MDFTPIYKFFAPKGDLLEPPPSSHPIIIDGYELCPDLIAMVQEQSFFRLVDEDPYTHLREFENCVCQTIAGMTQETPLNGNYLRSPFWEERNNGMLIL